MEVGGTYVDVGGTYVDEESVLVGVVTTGAGTDRSGTSDTGWNFGSPATCCVWPAGSSLDETWASLLSEPPPTIKPTPNSATTAMARPTRRAPRFTASQSNSAITASKVAAGPRIRSIIE